MNTDQSQQKSVLVNPIIELDEYRIRREAARSAPPDLENSADLLNDIAYYLMMAAKALKLIPKR